MADAAVGTDQLLPFERGESPADVHKSLLSALESDLGPDEPEGDDEPAAERDTKSTEAESDEEEEEASDEDESEEGDDESDEDDEEPEAERFYDVDGEKVSLQELKDGRLRQADYTRKTQALAEDRKKTEAEVVQLRGVREQYAERLEALALALKDTQPKEPDWEKLRKENPTEYVAQREDFRTMRERLTEVQAEQQRVRDEQAADWNKQRDAFLTAEKEKLNDAIPEWRDETKAKTEKAKLVDYVTRTYGWTTEDLAQVTDHRLMLVLRKAMLYDEGQTKGKEKIREKVKPAGAVLKPGSRDRTPQRGQKSATKRARQKLARTGRSEDAAAFIATLLDGG